MKRALALTGAFAAIVSLAACGQDGPTDEAQRAQTKSAAPTPVPTLAPVAAGKVTPNAERIATLGMLNKRNNITRDLVLKVGERRRVGNLVVRVQSCERTAPWEMPEETGAFVQVYVEEPPRPGADPIWRKVFSGWLFKNSPALNVVEHPVYDVWVKACAMNFPGEEAKPAPAASSSSAPKASGNASPAPAPAPSPSPSPSPSAAAPGAT
jgi:hypothetical protein